MGDKFFFVIRILKSVPENEIGKIAGGIVAEKVLNVFWVEQFGSVVIKRSERALQQVGNVVPFLPVEEFAPAVADGYLLERFDPIDAGFGHAGKDDGSVLGRDVNPSHAFAEIRDELVAASLVGDKPVAAAEKLVGEQGDTIRSHCVLRSY